MVSFVLCIAALVAGYFVYGRLVERWFGIDPARATPATTMRDGVDFVPMSGWRIFMIQFLNIAGLGPIFGPVLGAMYGPSAFLWIVLGSVFAGGVHDYLSGMLSLRHGGRSVSEVVGHYLGPAARQFMRLFSVVLLLLVGVVFVLGPAKLLNGTTGWPVANWTAVIFIYYVLATLLPIDKLIGRIYPVFGAALLVMAFGLAGALLVHRDAIPEITWASLANQHVDPDKFPLFPMVFITIACGAISGFHSTQSPMMARCMASERLGRPIFFGAMIAEGLVALVWAAAAMTFFGGAAGLNEQMVAHHNNAAWAVSLICNTWLGKVGGILALIGVVACPLTSGDTAFRSVRLNIADLLNLSQKPIANRLLICVPLFALAFGVSLMKFDVVWRYFAWSNQTLATIVLWAAAAYLAPRGRIHWMATAPAVVMTAVCASYILLAPEGFKLPVHLSIGLGAAAAAAALAFFLLRAPRARENSV